MRLLRSYRCLCLIAALLAWASLATPVSAAPSSEIKCKSFKLKTAASVCQCRMKALAKAAKKGIAADFAKCDTKLSDSFTKVENKEECRPGGTDDAVGGHLEPISTTVDTALDDGSAEDAALKCRSGKLKTTGKYCGCLLKARRKADIKEAILPDFSKCDAKLDKGFSKAEDKAGGTCTAIDDKGAISDLVLAGFVEVEADLADLGTADFASGRMYGIGVRTLDLVDLSRPTDAKPGFAGAPERTFPTKIWYPTDGSTRLGESSNAPISTVLERYPIILRAHGLSGSRIDSSELTMHLASRGYVVVSPQFPLSNLFTPGGPTAADIDNQALDLSFFIDTMLGFQTDVDDLFFDRLDTDTIGAVGHSLGGITVLLGGYHVTHRDPRLDAVVALAPFACPLVDGFFDPTATAPLMVVGGTVDAVTSFSHNQVVPYSYANAPKYFVEITNGTHIGFTNRLGYAADENGDEVTACPIFIDAETPRPVETAGLLGFPVDYLGGLAAGFDPDGGACGPLCPPAPAEFMLQARQQDLTLATTLAMFDATLLGDVSASRMLTGRLNADNDDLVLTVD